MRLGQKDSGWVGSLFDEPIDQVKAPSDRCICHQDCPQYETCETEALDKSSKVYYLLRCVKGKFPACANCMCMACDLYHECKDGPEMGLRGGTRYRMCNRPISITGCLDYSGSIPWRSEAYCKECDHICDLRKELVWAPRVRCDLNPIEPTKKPTEEPSPVQLDGKPTVEHPTLIRYGHETWGQYELEGRLVEEFVSTDKPVRKESEFAADMVAVDAARKAAGDLPLARSFIEKGARGIRVYEDPALQEGGTLCCQLVVSKQNGGLCTGCSDQRGTPCSYSRPAEHTSPEPAVAPAKPSKAKKQHKLTRADYDNNPLPGSNADTCSHCDCETCGLNQAHLNYTDKEWASCPPCGCDQCLGKDELQPTTLCGRKATLTVDVLGNTESQLPMEQQHMVTLQRYVRQFCGDCKCLTCGRAYQNCAMDGDEPYHICSICTLEHAHHHKPYPAIIKDCEHWIDKATFPADIYAPGQGPCPETACELRYNGEGGPCLCHSCKYGPGSCDTSCNIPGYPMETGQYGCEWYAPKVATPEGPTTEFDALAAELDEQMLQKRLAAELALPEAQQPKHGRKYWDVPDLVKVGDLVTRLHTRGYVYDIYKVTRVEKTDAGWQICGDRWDDFRHPKRKNVSKNEPIIRWDVTGWKAEEGKVVPLREKVAEGTFGAKYNEKYADEQLIVLTLEQVEQLVAVEEAEDVNGPTNYTHVWLKPEKAKGTLNDLHSDWPLLGHARFVDTSAAAVAKIPSGRRSEVCQDEPECEQCHCHTCQHQKACRLDNTLGPCSPCKTSGGAHHHKAVDCEGCTPSP